VRTRVEELPESRVRLEVEVPEDDVKHAFDHAASDLAGSLKVPGFRKGKVPVPVVVARVGRSAVWEEALRGHLDGWFWNAASRSGIRPVGNPEVAYEEAPDEGGTFTFTATVPVVPKPELADWTILEVGAAEPEVSPDLVDAEIDALRSSVAELAPVTGRPARMGDTVVLDLGFEDGKTQRDYVVELGDERLVDEIEEAVVGMSAGETKHVEIELADDTSSGADVTVTEIKEKVLPAADDELARAASEFDTIAELRDDIEARLREQLEAELEVRFREAAVDALAEASTITGIEPMVERRTQELLAGLVRSLERRGISVDTYLATTGQTEEQVVARLAAEARLSLERELVLDAVADKLELEVTDEEIETIVREQASEAEENPDEAVKTLRERGGFDTIRGDLRLRRALDEVVKGVKRIPLALAQAREQLWTPEKEKGGTKMNIWTPGSEEGR
jgi:trigger factor